MQVFCSTKHKLAVTIVRLRMDFKFEIFRQSCLCYLHFLIIVSKNKLKFNQNKYCFERFCCANHCYNISSSNFAINLFLFIILKSVKSVSNMTDNYDAYQESQYTAEIRYSLIQNTPIMNYSTKGTPLGNFCFFMAKYI